MLFNSVEFAIFFPCVALLYFLLEHRFRWILLLGASCAFYMFFIPKYILILALTIVVDYWAAIFIENTQGSRRRLALVVSILSTCLILAVFKYYNFFLSNVETMSHCLGWNYHVRLLNIILPIGLSFHTFQSLSYVIEVYRGNQKAERHFGIYSLYVMFFPQLVAGPIERPQNLLHQFRERHSFDPERVRRGLQLAAWGLFKKVVIADRLSLLVNQVYSGPQVYAGIVLIVATVFFAFQIYCDFSGYSDIAIGCAEVLGFKLMTNFRRPYLSVSVAEFWQRWHISLSTWFRDYLYIPLGGNRGSFSRWQFNLLATFLVSGLWHGANWTYIAWGGINGFYLVVENLLKRVRSGREVIQIRTIRCALTFALICVSWIFFRAEHVSSAWYVLTHLFSMHGQLFPENYRYLGGCLALIAGLLFLENYQERFRLREWVSRLPSSPRWAIYYAGISLLYFIGIYGRNQFIYFQF